MKSYDVRFAYYRPELQYNPVFLAGGIVFPKPMTVAYQKVANHLDVISGLVCAFSICNPKDRFVKEEGRKIATERLKSNEPSEFKFEISNDLFVAKISDHPEYNIFKVVNENFSPYVLQYAKHSAISHFVVQQALEIVSRRS